MIRLVCVCVERRECVFLRSQGVQIGNNRTPLINYEGVIMIVYESSRKRIWEVCLADLTPDVLDCGDWCVWFVESSHAL